MRHAGGVGAGCFRLGCAKSYGRPAARRRDGQDSRTQAFLRAGIEIRIDPGWKTYWRDPGDSGVPPTFDFSGSDNVKSVTVLWPAPERFSDGAGGHSIGYVDHVILPLQVTPQDAAKPSALNLKLGYAICGNLCVPVESDLKLPLNGNGAEDRTIEQAQARVPRRVPLGPGKGLAILSVHREDGEPHPRVLVDVAAPAGAPVDLFVEGPTRIGRCRCRNQCPAPPATTARRGNSPSISTGCRPTPRLKARR